MARFLVLILLALTICSFFSCGWFQSAKHEPVEGNGFVTVNAAAAVIAMGSNDTTRPPFERPRMYTSFSENFQVYRTEVTNGEFAELAGYSPFEVKNDPDDVPVRSVNWYEAMFYCNRLSAKLGLDSVYE